MIRNRMDDLDGLLDPETWDAPDHLSEEEWRVEAGPDWRRARSVDDESRGDAQ